MPHRFMAASKRNRVRIPRRKIERLPFEPSYTIGRTHAHGIQLDRVLFLLHCGKGVSEVMQTLNVNESAAQRLIHEVENVYGRDPKAIALAVKKAKRFKRLCGPIKRKAEPKNK